MTPPPHLEMLDGGAAADTGTHALSHGRLLIARGPAPAILFVHGGFHGAWCWKAIANDLAARGVGSAAVDLRGHGGLPQDDSFVTQRVSEMVFDVAEAAAHLPRGVILAGHSLGALLALCATERVSPRALILLAPAAPRGIAARRVLPRFQPATPVLPPGPERARKWFLSHCSPDDFSEYHAKLCAESPALLNECFHDGVEIPAGAYEVPILCLSGGRDISPLHTAGQDREIAERLNARLHVIRDAGHCLMLDDGRHEAAEAIQRWIDSLSS